MAGEAKRGLSSWLHRPGGRLEEQSAPSSAAAASGAGVAAAVDATSPVDMSLAILRAKETISRISPDKRALVEEIDEEDDDAEFDEKAHWGRRSTATAAARRKKRKASKAAAASPGYSIKAFCVPQETKASGDAAKTQVDADTDECKKKEGDGATDGAGVAADVQEFIAEDAEYVPESTEVSEELGAGVGDARNGDEEEADSDDDQELEDEAMEDSSSSTAKDDTESADDESDAAKKQESSDAPVEKIQQQQQEEEEGAAGSESAQQETTASSRPKRQAVLRAQEAQQQAKKQSPLHSGKKAAKTGMAAFIDLRTPPQKEPGKKASTSSKRAGAASKISSQTLELKSTPSVGRKRKLEMDKSTPSPAAKAIAKGSFFLSEQEKKQQQEIEAVAKLREQLRKTREKDLAFFSGKTAVNPFFQAPPPQQPPKSSKSASEESVDIIDIDEDGAVDSTPGKGAARSRWSKEAALFPAFQHVFCADVDDIEDQRSVATGIRRKAADATAPDDVVVLDDDDEMHNSFTSSAASMQQQVHTEASLTDVFWFQQYREVATTDAKTAEALVRAGEQELSPQLRFPVEYETESSLIEALVETYGMGEKRVREMYDGLFAAKQKRREKEHNLTIVDRYVPVSASGIVGNKEALRMLSSWLGAWKLGGGVRDRQNCFQAELYVFEGDDSDEDELSDLCRLFILEGESGSGKSAAVYACAEELGYNVIEINAGQSRAGRSIVEIVGEATQSTRVLHMSNPADKSKKVKKVTKKRSRKSVDSSAAHLSLVLFEDVDLVFEEDKGFLSSLCSIAKRSKCPIVLTCRELPDNFPAAPQRLSQKIVRPSAKEFCTWMSLVAYLEGLPLLPVLVETLAQFFKCDIRQSLHFMQLNLSQLVTKQRAAQWTWRPKADAAVASSADQKPGRGRKGSGGAATVPIEIHDGDDDEDDDDEDPPPIFVHAWTHYPERAFDMMSSNLLLEFAACGGGKAEEDKSAEEKKADARLIESLSATLDAVSVADLWGASHDQDHEVSCFDKERSHLRSLDLRAASLSALLTPGGSGALALQRRSVETSSGECVRRSLDAALADEQRRSRKPAMNTVKAKMELPLVALGAADSSSRFNLDYMPMLSRIASSSASHQQSRRRASRRNHYLSGVISDMSLLDEIHEFTTFVHVGDSDQIVAASPSSSPLPS